MERLTRKHDFFDYVLPEQNVVGDNQATEISLGETEYTCKKYIVGEAIKKIGELEDALEKYNIENIEDLELRLEDIEHYAYQANKQLIDILAKYNIENLEEYISALIEERKLAIEEAKIKFKRYKDETIKREKLEHELAELKQKAIVPKYKIKQYIWLARNNVFQKEPCELIVQNIEYHFKTNDFIYIVDFVEKGHHKSINMCDNGDLFATKKEAEQKLAEIGRKDE